MARDDSTAQDGTETTAELRQALAAHFKGRPLPPDLLITTRAEVERREFRAYGQGWRDRGEHDERRRAETTRAAAPRPSPTDATVLPFPHPSGPSAARSHPHDEPS